MSLEDLTGNKFINALVRTNPDGATDPKSQGDDHIRGIKNVILNTFPAIDGPVTVDQDEINTLAGNARTVAHFAPVGMLAPFAGASAPDGWLLCNGQAVSRATYADLFAAIGTTFGAGDGLTTFNVPDLRGRTAVGLDNMGGSSANRITGSWADSLGGVGGAEKHTLTINEMPSHNHGGGNHNHSGIPIGRAPSDEPTTSNGFYYGARASAGASTYTTPNSGTIINSQGGGQAHNNVQPSIALNWIIKT